MVHFSNLVTNFRSLAHEAEADERAVQHEIGRHRRIATKREVLYRKGHHVAKHCVHILLLTWAGLPAILAFETARPLWVKYVETPITDITVGHDAVVSHTTEVLNLLIAHYLH